MAQTLTCSQGHHWQTEAAASDAATLLCPVCGTAASLALGAAATPVPATLPASAAEWPSAAKLAVPGYEVLGELGRGGMSIVYKARHLKLNRVVAVKMLTAGAHAGPDLLQRFQREAESFARLTHPNIVQIHEAGWVEPQGPYLTLEYVEGGSLAQKLARLPQPPRHAAEVVAVLARAVHFAHERGVLHRDLKPANVMLTADGTPKVTDFGLARFLQAEAVAAPDSPTPTGAVLGTPSYMAPEQASGVTRAPTVAIDVYALGAVLYEMLTGRPPFLGEGPLETTLLVLMDDPVPPRRLQSKVPRDLETICLHCLRKNPKHRYPTADALADDLQRFLDGRPIQVRPAGPVERLAKWARGRPAVAALLTVSAVAVLAGLGLTGWYNYQLTRKNTDLTRANTDLKNEKDLYDKLLVLAVDTMSDYGEAADDAVAPLPNSEQARRELLEKRLTFFEPFLQLSSDDPRLQRRKARALLEVANIHTKLGDPVKAEQQYNESIALYETALRGSESAELRHELAQACVQFGILLDGLHRRDEAERLYRRGAGLLDGLVDEGRGDPAIRRNLAATYHNLGVLLGNEQSWADGLDALAKAMALCEAMIAEDDDQDHDRLMLAENYASRCGLYRLKGDVALARPDAETALKLLNAVGPSLKSSEAYRNSFASVHFQRGLLLTRSDENAGRVEFEAAWRSWDQLAREHPDAPAYRFHAAEARHWVGRLDSLADHWADAEAAFREADRLYLSLPAAWKDDRQWRESRRQNRYYLGEALNGLGQYDEAETIFRELIDQLPQDPSPHEGLSEALNGLGTLSLKRAQVVALLPPVGLTVLPNPLGMGVGWQGQQESAHAEMQAAMRRFREVVDDLGLVGTKYGAEGLPEPQRRLIIARRFLAADGLGKAAWPLGDREQLSCATETVAELGEAWFSLSNRPLAALYFRQAATDACGCRIIVQGDLKLSEEQKAAQARADAQRMVQLLRRAVEAGLPDAANLKGAIEVTNLMSDSSPYLRGPREEMKKLLAELELKPQP